MKNEMTDYQFVTVLKMILSILDGCKDIQEAKDKINDLISERKPRSGR